MTTVGVLHPGEMGAAVAAALAPRHTVLWASEGRSAATADRAAAAGLADTGTAAALAGRCDVLLSVCPPHSAVDVARSVSGLVRPGGIFVDANAVSPATARTIADITTSGGAACVDGGIVGPPPSAEHGTRLYLSGERADAVAALFGGTAVDARTVGKEPGAASAVKMAYAAWTKGSAALVLASRALARAEGVEDTLLGEWAQSLPEVEGRSRSAARSAAAKGWRWSGEMEEIADTMQAAGLPDGFHRAAAEIFRRSPRSSSAGADTDEVVAALVRHRPADLAARRDQEDRRGLPKAQLRPSGEAPASRSRPKPSRYGRNPRGRFTHVRRGRRAGPARP